MIKIWERINAEVVETTEANFVKAIHPSCTAISEKLKYSFNIVKKVIAVPVRSNSPKVLEGTQMFCLIRLESTVDGIVLYILSKTMGIVPIRDSIKNISQRPSKVNVVSI